ncbi:hypothetical protein [Acinetobacter faecalis]|uniref:hypothetical protein n=1 Tax=Acinetobacter faecalis TaxID=2665161 RepID=UPI002A908A9B|nr:hypothetical protein [Acinetobacter faecalis]MDY6490462.1 hypothetical protein [Acinetobacter faecalis]
MSPKIFFEDFERTENSDYLHGIFGRCLVIATRFDSMCVRMSKIIKIKEELIIRKVEKTLNELNAGNTNSKIRTDEEFNLLIEKVISKYISLDDSIKTLNSPKKLSQILHKARKSRNEIAHSLTMGLEGCIDTKIDNVVLLKEVERLIGDIVDGDIIISSIISRFNNEPILNKQSLLQYKQQIIEWVISP